MRVTLLGHASLVIEGGGVTVAMDPVFFDPFQDDMVVSCPKRRVNVEALPSFDAVILSHDHLDHFQPRTLALLSKQTPVICPRDSPVEQMIQDEGFQRIIPVAANSELDFDFLGSLRVWPTPSAATAHD